MGRSSLATDSHRSGTAVLPDAITRKRLEKRKMEHLRLQVCEKLGHLMSEDDVL